MLASSVRFQFLIRLRIWKLSEFQIFNATKNLKVSFENWVSVSFQINSKEKKICYQESFLR